MNQRLTESPAWHALQTHYEKIKDIHLRQLFADDTSRGDRLVAKAAGLYLDYSKNRITNETVLLIQLANERGVAERRDAMFRGEKINITENHAVLHVALRAPRGTQIKVDGVDVVPEVRGRSLPRKPNDGSAQTGLRTGPDRVQQIGTAVFGCRSVTFPMCQTGDQVTLNS